MYRTALRNLLAHRARLLMTALAILLGTAFTAGSMVFADTADQAAANSFSKNVDDLSVLVTDHSGAAADGPGTARTPATGLTDATVARIAALPGVAGVRPVVAAFTGVADRHGTLIGPAWSATGTTFVPGADGTDPRYPMLQGHGPRAAGEIALDRQTARQGGYRVGDTVRITTGDTALNAVLTGVFTSRDPMVTAGGSLTLLTTAQAQQLLLSPGRFSSIEATAAAGTSDQALRSEIAPLVPDGNRFAVQTATQLRQQQAGFVAQRTHSMEAMLLTFSGIALFVGVFIIANTFSMLIAQRTRELALLRAIGASRGQVARSLLAEAVLVGLAGSTAGLLVGIGLGAGLKSGLRSVSHGLPDGPLVVTPGTAGTVLAVGVLVTVASAVLPALRAARVAPVAALGSAEQPATRKSLVLRNSAGALVTAAGLGLVLLAVGSAHGKPQRIELGAALAAIGILILLPLLSRPVIALAGPLLVRLFGAPGRLAQRNAVRDPRRTAATAGALAIGLTLVTAMTVVGSSVTAAVTASVNGSVRADLTLTSSTGSSLPAGLPSAVAKAPGVVAAGQVISMAAAVNGTTHTVDGLDADSFQQLVALRMTAGSADALRQGRLLVDTDLAANDRLAPGTSVTVAYPDGTSGVLTVGGVFRANPLLSSVLLANSVVSRHDPHPFVTLELVKGGDGPGAALRQAVTHAAGDNPVIAVRDRQEAAAKDNRTVDSAMSLLTVLLGMSVLVAALGVVNTMAMSVTERRREIGLLRALGLERGRVRTMVQLESVVVSLFGATVGLALGGYLAWAAVDTLTVELPGITTVLPYRLLLLLPLAGVIGLLAALWPARQAAGTGILESIQEA